MKFQILHESRGRVRLRAMQRSMSMVQVDLLEAWIRTLPGVDQVTVHERICGVTILFTGERDTLYSALSRFSYVEAEEEAHVLSPHSRQINREYKEKLVFQVLRHYGKKLLLPLPLRQVINTLNALPRIWLAAKTLLRGRLTVEVLDGVTIGSGAGIAREVADITIAAEDLRELVLLRKLSQKLMGRIERNYRFVMGFNGALIALVAVGVLGPATSALLHNSSTLLLSMDCLTDLLSE